MRILMLAAGLAVLGACAPQVPDSGKGIGFDSAQARAQREAALTASTAPGPIVPRPSAVSSETIASGTPATRSAPQASDDAAQIASETTAALANSGVAPVNASPSNPPPVAVNTAGISDENDFGAVSGRQTIQSDAERIAQNRANYQVIQPEALPTRSGSNQPNIVSYALETKHPRGTKVHSRSRLNSAAKAQRNCAKYASADQAQIEFLSRGGPARDRSGLDPDGDGYACSWDPAPFRKLSTN